MSKTITQIQTLVRYEARDSQFSLVDTQGTAIGNAIYRRLAALIDWPELNKPDISLSTTAGTATYTWPATYNYLDVKQVSIQDPFDDSKYKQISAAPSELEFLMAQGKPDAFPELYRRAHNGTNNILVLAPAPDISGLNISILGQVEPSEYTAAGDSTVFLDSSADDALVFLIAADIADKRAQPNRAQSLIQRAAEILSKLAGREIIPAELKSSVLNA